MKQKKARVKFNFKKIFINLFFLFIIIALYLFIKYRFLIMDNPINANIDNTPNIISNVSEVNKIKPEYEIVSQDFLPNYAGIGRQKIENKDGYSTTFTTINTNKKIYNEYKQNGNSSWSNHSYWEGTMESDGCLITAMSIILSGYEKNYTPEDLRQTYFPVLSADKISTELNSSFGISNTDFFFDSTHLSKDYIEKHLKTNRPILICVWNKPNNNRWTTESHYLVLLATDGNEMVYVSNPNGLDNTYKSSGWYNINEITPYIAKALFIEKK